MTFPTTPLDTKVELELDGAWTNVTAYAYTRDPITITRGRADEASGVDPSSCALTFNNRDGRFSPRNPTGPYYGVIGRNTPVRVSALLGLTRFTGPASVSTPDSAGLSIVGDIDIRVEASLLSWANGGGARSLVGKYGAAGQRSYQLLVAGDGRVTLGWSADGTAELSAGSTVPLPVSTGRQAVRATLDVNNGAAGRTATFYTAPTMAGPWTQLGDPVVQAGVTSIFDSTDPLRVSCFANMVIYAAQVYQGIAGTVRANPDFTAQAEGATSFADGAGNTWTAGAGRITARRYRFYGEVSSWPSSWDLSGNDVWVPVQAAGVLRRLGQGQAALQGTMQRFVLANQDTHQAYWPAEDESGATSIASGLPSGPPMVITGTPDLAASDSFGASGPLPEMALAAFSGPVNAYASTGIIHARCLMFVPAAGATDRSMILRLFTTGTASRWDYFYTTGGNLEINAYDSFGVNLFSQAVAFAVNGKALVVALELVQDGADIDWRMLTKALSTGDELEFSGTLAARTVGAATFVQVNQNQLFDETVIGQIAIESALPDTGDLGDAFRGYVDETAGRRIERLCGEQGVAFSGYGNLDDSAAMGVQRSDQLLTLLAECQVADLGMLLEPRDSFGLGYRVRSSLYSQGAALPADYGDTRSLQPVEDDQGTRNDITVSRLNGSSARQELAVGSLSTQAPPDGVGRYDEAIQINVATDGALPDQAAWRLHLGTVDEARYPTVGLLLESSPFASSATLTSQALDLDIGDLLTIANPPAWLPPEDIRQIAQGFTEVLAPFSWSIEVNCSPASPYDVGLYDQDDPLSRYDTDGCELAEVLDTTETSIDVTTTSGPVWTQTPAEFPFDIEVGGERITVAGVSGATAAQTFTGCTRSVNGVVKTHAIGADVRLADPDHYAL